MTDEDDRPWEKYTNGAPPPGRRDRADDAADVVVESELLGTVTIVPGERRATAVEASGCIAFTRKEIATINAATHGEKMPADVARAVAEVKRAIPGSRVVGARNLRDR